ncbi:MAG: sensor histidine kinase [Oscillospiraceae bacterium]|nr:sensor histidine kinase [Oscillospiraceae bacterium]
MRQLISRWKKRIAARPKSLRVKIMISLLLLSFAMVLYTGIVSYRLASDKVTDISLRLSESNTASAVSVLNDNLDSVHEWSNQFTSIPELQKTALQENGPFRYDGIISRDVMGLIANADSYGPRYEFVSVLLKNGYTHLSNADFTLPFTDYESCVAYFSEQKDEMEDAYTTPLWMLCPVTVADHTEQILVYIRFLYRPVTMEKLGVLVFGLQENWLSSLYDSYAPGAFILTKDGILYSACDNAKAIGTTYQQNAALLDVIRGKQMSSAASAVYVGDDGKEHIVSYQQLNSMQAYLVVPFDLYTGISSQEINSYLLAVILMGILGLATTAILSITISKSLSRSIFDLTEFTKRVETGQTELRYEPTGRDEIAYLGRQINDMLDQLQTAASQRVEGLRANQELELQLNQMQINPHLLYNTLDSALWVLKQEQNEDVAALITAMSGFFKISLSKGHMRIPLSDELRLIEHYINIQRLARQKEIHMEYDIEEALYGLSIIKLTLQPLVENAVVHGFSGYRDDGTIQIKAARNEAGIVILVTDNGIGMLPEEVDEINQILQYPALPEHFHHFGLFNINRRIVQAFGKNYGLYVESEVGSYTTIRMLIPSENDGSREETKDV